MVGGVFRDSMAGKNVRSKSAVEYVPDHVAIVNDTWVENHVYGLHVARSSFTMLTMPKAKTCDQVPSSLGLL